MLGYLCVEMVRDDQATFPPLSGASGPQKCGQCRLEQTLLPNVILLQSPGGQSQSRAAGTPMGNGLGQRAKAIRADQKALLHFPCEAGIIISFSDEQTGLVSL